MPSVAFRADVVPVGQRRISTGLSRTIDAQQTTGSRVRWVRSWATAAGQTPLVDRQSGPIAQGRYT